MDSLSLSRKYDKFLDKIQQKEAEIPLHQTESEQPHQKEVLQQQQSAPLLSFSILYLSNSLSIALYSAVAGALSTQAVKAAFQLWYVFLSPVKTGIVTLLSCFQQAK